MTEFPLKKYNTRLRPDTLAGKDQLEFAPSSIVHMAKCESGSDAHEFGGGVGEMYGGNAPAIKVN